MPLYRRDTRAGKSDALDHHDKAQRDTLTMAPGFYESLNL